jgi:hypothetical protein
MGARHLVQLKQSLRRRQREVVEQLARVDPQLDDGQPRRPAVGVLLTPERPQVEGVTVFRVRRVHHASL